MATNATSSEAIDGVQRLPSSGIDVLVVGAGVGGMLTALECWRQGHSVRVLEKTDELSVIGDVFSLLPSALSTLSLYPTMKKQFEAESYDAEFSVWMYTGKMILYQGEAAWNQPGETHTAKGVYVPWLARRLKVAQMLEAQCTRLGIQIQYGKGVVKYEEDGERCKGRVNCADGSIEEADVVVAADGLGTKSHLAVTGHEVRAEGSGYSGYRGFIDMSEMTLTERARADYFGGKRPEFRIFLDRNMHANIMPLGQEGLAYIITHQDDGSAEELWKSTAPADQVIATLEQQGSGWDPVLLDILRQIPPNSCVDWKFVYRDPQPKWTSDGGHIIQLGDAAHSFIPTSGNGATQAMEDAISLATCLRLCRGKEDVGMATKVHTKLRFERVSTLQKFGFTTRRFLHNMDLEMAQKNPEMVEVRLPRFVYTHDPAEYAEQNYDKALRHLMYGTEFVNTNTPPGSIYEDWTVAGEREKEERGIPSDRGLNGDWS